MLSEIRVAASCTELRARYGLLVPLRRLHNRLAAARIGLTILARPCELADADFAATGPRSPVQQPKTMNLTEWGRGRCIRARTHPGVRKRPEATAHAG